MIPDEFLAKINNNYKAYFKNGVLYDVYPRNKRISLDEDKQTAYDASYYVIDNIIYNLNDPESIKKITLPEFQETYTTRDLSYIIKMRAIAEPRPEIAVPLVYKLLILCFFHKFHGVKKIIFD